MRLFAYGAIGRCLTFPPPFFFGYALYGGDFYLSPDIYIYFLFTSSVLNWTEGGLGLLIFVAGFLFLRKDAGLSSISEFLLIGTN